MSFLHDIHDKAVYDVSDLRPQRYLLDSRGFTQEQIKDFKLGYIGSRDYLKDDGSTAYKDFLKKTRGSERIRDSILIPVHNLAGSVVGLNCRFIEPKPGVEKYFNFTSEGAKRDGVFFGIMQALPYIRKTKVVYVTEGSFDAISLSSVLPNTVSAMTNSLFEDQFWILDQIAEKIVIIFDSDERGKEGAEIVQNKYKSKKVVLKELRGKDPNSLLTSSSKEEFENYVLKYLTILR